MSKPAYQIVFLGHKNPIAAPLATSLLQQFHDLGLDATEVKFLTNSDFSNLDRKIPALSVYFGGPDGSPHEDELNQLIEDSLIIIPVVSNISVANEELPEALKHVNALEVPHNKVDVSRLTSLILENFRLLRRERRLFISYKRKDSQSLANQLYDEFDRRGFDVFIDIRSVPPAVDFQSELWHRMSDSDLMVLIDTPSFMMSRWTVEELAQANLTNIQILHLLWPGQSENTMASFSHYYPLRVSDFEDGICSQAAKLTNSVLAQICQTAESLRARAMAARHRYLVDNFCDTARDQGLNVQVQPERWISVTLPSGNRIAVVAAVGVPTSHRIHLIHNSIGSHPDGTFSQAWVIYDNRGILPSWLHHLTWLNGFLPLKAVQMANILEVLVEAAA